MPRKTFEIATFMEQANTMLRLSGGTVNARETISTLVESTLMSAGVYAGFRYLHESELAVGELPGVRMGPNGEVLSYEERFVDTDSSRRQYFWKQ
jgi:hypothetical protein